MNLEIAGFIVGVAGIGFGVWQWYQSLSLRREASRLRLPVVEIEGDAGWEPDQLGNRELRVHADMINRGPGPVRDMEWGVTIAGEEQSHGGNHLWLPEGREITYEMFVVRDALVSKVSGNPQECTTWWVRYTNTLGDRIEMRFTAGEILKGPFVVSRARRHVWSWFTPAAAR